MKAKVFFIRTLFFFTALPLLFYACAPVYDLRHQDFASAYNPVQSFLFLHAQVLHTNSDTSFLVLEIPREQNAITRDTATFLIRYKSFESLSATISTDSAFIIHGCVSTEKYFHFEIPLLIKSGATGYMKIFVSENFSSKQTLQIVEFKKQGNASGFIFPVRLSDNTKYILQYADAHTVFRLRNVSGDDTFRVSYFGYKFPLAVPTFFAQPLINYPEKVDTVFVFTSTDTFSFRKSGLYVFTSSKNPQQHFSLVCSGNSFPSISEADELAAPLRYISKNEEYDYINHSNVRARVDSFWIEKSGDADHAKDMIRRYYNRVQFANEFFTSYQPGWQTDMGLVFIIFGAPDQVYYDEDAVWWLYKPRGNRGNIRYKFVRTENPFGAKSFTLVRSPNYFDSWNRQGYAWRHGLAD